MPTIVLGAGSGGIGQNAGVGLGILRAQGQARGLDQQQQGLDLREQGQTRGLDQQQQALDLKAQGQASALDMQQQAFDLREQALRDVQDERAANKTAQAEFQSWTPTTQRPDAQGDMIALEGNALISRAISNGASPQMVGALQGQLSEIQQQNKQTQAAEEISENLMGLQATDPAAFQSIAHLIPGLETDLSGTSQRIQSTLKDHYRAAARTAERLGKYQAAQGMLAWAQGPGRQMFPDVMDPMTGQPAMNPVLQDAIEQSVTQMLDAGFGGIAGSQVGGGSGVSDPVVPDTGGGNAVTSLAQGPLPGGRLGKGLKVRIDRESEKFRTKRQKWKSLPAPSRASILVSMFSQVNTQVEGGKSVDAAIAAVLSEAGDPKRSNFTTDDEGNFAPQPDLFDDFGNVLELGQYDPALVTVRSILDLWKEPSKKRDEWMRIMTSPRIPGGHY